MQVSLPLSAALSEASRVIAAVIGGKNVDLVLATVPAPVRPATQEIAYGALRQYGRGDFLLGRLLTSPLKEVRIRALLLAALYRLELQPEDGHTIVNQAVETAGEMLNGRFRALTNAVLRNFLRQRDLLLQNAGMDSVAHWQHPSWWIARLNRNMPDFSREILAAGNGRSAMTLRVNCRKTTPENYLAELHHAGIGARLLRQSAICLEKPQAVDRLPGFADGRVSVQDFGAQQAAGLLDVTDGMRVLDACAAPGGKTAHLLESADLELTALDADATRLKRVAENLQRLGLSARLLAVDCRNLKGWWDGNPFDRILADVPCSASGVVRRHPDVKWLRRESDIVQFAALQAEILDALWQVLAPGGKMLYCTCSIFTEENRMQIDSFLRRHRDLADLSDANLKHDEQLIPNTDHDGFYYAVLEKHA